MADDNKIPTLGGSTSGKGFSKKPMPVQMQVSAEEVQKMQQGYELRIARQRDAITRLQRVAGAQVEMFEEWMRNELERAGRIEESDQAPMITRDSTGYDMDSEEINAQLSELLGLIPKEWDMYNDDDTPFSILRAYIRDATDDAANHRRRADSFGEWLSNHVRGKGRFVLGEGSPFNEVRRYVKYLEDELHTTQQSLFQAIADARHNAKQANQALQVVDADETPPWMREEQSAPVAFVQPATVGASGVWDNEPDRRDSKTLDDWAPDDNKLPPGEIRPGSF